MAPEQIGGGYMAEPRFIGTSPVCAMPRRPAGQCRRCPGEEYRRCHVGPLDIRRIVDRDVLHTPTDPAALIAF